MYRFLLSRRWVGAFALAVVVAVGCVLLGMWQWDRREARLERNALVTGNYDRDPVRLGAVLSDPVAALPPRGEWTPVTMIGRYVEASTVLLRNRPLDGRPGYHVLVPFESGSAVVLVDRGWLPIGATGIGPDEVPAPPPGVVEVMVRLRPGEAGSDRGAPPGQTQKIDLPAIAGAAPSALGSRLHTGAYGVLASEAPAAAQAPRPLTRPAIDEGPHLSYALQWFVFSLGALAGFVVLARRTAADAGGTGAGPRRPRQRSRPSAEDEEDALLDAGERADAIAVRSRHSVQAHGTPSRTDPTGQFPVHPPGGPTTGKM